MAQSFSVRFERISKTFRQGDREITVLDKIDLEVPEGSFVALMGPSGSGKSTLLNLVAGLVKPTQGSVKVGAFDPSTMSEDAVCDWRSRHVGYIFQRYHLLGVLDAAHNVEVPLLFSSLSRAERRRRVQVALELVGLQDRAHHYPRQLSGGQEQRVAIARAIVADPTVVLADEPTGDLDAQSAHEILDLLALLNQRLQRTILMVTHDPMAAQRAQRVLRLEKGFIFEEVVG